jgi:hypothetical protein
LLPIRSSRCNATEAGDELQVQRKRRDTRRCRAFRFVVSLS